MKCNDTKLNIKNINKEGDLAETPPSTHHHFFTSINVIIQKKVLNFSRDVLQASESYATMFSLFPSCTSVTCSRLLYSRVLRVRSLNHKKYLEMFLVIFSFDLSVALRCTDEVPCNYVTTSSLYPPQMHHTHPGTINLFMT